jgi:hypothetical protein
MRAISLQALMTVIKRHKIEPVNGQYHFTIEMAAEAAAIDEARGMIRDVPPEEFDDLKAAIEGRPNSGKWEAVEIGEEL